MVDPPRSSPPEEPAGVDANTSMVVLRVWAEAHDRELRGRLIAPSIAGPTSAKGAQQLGDLLQRALQVIAHDLQAGRDADATPQ